MTIVAEPIGVDHDEGTAAGAVSLRGDMETSASTFVAVAISIDQVQGITTGAVGIAPTCSTPALASEPPGDVALTVDAKAGADRGGI